MAKLSDQLQALFSEWRDNIRKEIDRLKMDNTAKVNEILALRNAIRENENELDAIGRPVRAFANDALDVAEEADNARDYAAYVVDMVDGINDYCLDKDEDEDKEPITYCDNCGRAIWDEDEVVDGYEGEYCCDECREEAEDEEESEDEAEVAEV